MSLELGTLIVAAIAILGWIYQLGFQGARLDRVVEDQSKTQDRLTVHIEDVTIHPSPEWRLEMLRRFDRLEGKVDKIMEDKHC